MKSYTSIEQSKKLLELGIPAESADMYWFLDPTPAGNIYHLTIQRVDIGVKYLPEYNKGDIPCWSLAALLELMPKIIQIPEGDYLSLHIYFSNEGEFLCKYGYPHESLYSVLMTGNSYIEVAFNMVCWLLENGYIKKGK